MCISMSVSWRAIDLASKIARRAHSAPPKNRRVLSCTRGVLKAPVDRSPAAGARSQTNTNQTIVDLVTGDVSASVRPPSNDGGCLV